MKTALAVSKAHTGWSVPSTDTSPNSRRVVLARNTLPTCTLALLTKKASFALPVGRSRSCVPLANSTGAASAPSWKVVALATSTRAPLCPSSNSVVLANSTGSASEPSWKVVALATSALVAPEPMASSVRLANSALVAPLPIWSVVPSE